MKVVITGGHHSSALPVIDFLMREDPEIKLYWFGHKYSGLGDKNPTLEYKEISALNIPFFNLKAGKVYKTFNIKRLAKVPYGFFQSLCLLAKIRPDIILSFGGYLSVPVVLAGWLFRIPSVTHEQTIVVGWANKVVSKFAKKIMVTWPSSLDYFPKRKTVFTGLPLRKAIFKSASNSFELNKNLPTVYLTAGKQGSHIMNEIVRETLPDVLKKCNLIHQCGDNSVFDDYTNLESSYKRLKKEGLGVYHLRKFVLEGEIGEAYSKAALVLARAGAHTTYEILALEKPAILIPIPWVSHNEQFKNAKVVEDTGLGIILEQEDLNKATFLSSLSFALTNINELRVKDKKYKNILVSNSAEKIADVLIETAKKNFKN